MAGEKKRDDPERDTEEKHKLYALPETLEQLSRYREALMRYLPQIAGSDVLILTPNDIRQTGLKIPGDDKNWNSKMMQAVLERVPGLDYRHQDIEALVAANDPAADALSAMCGQMQRGYNNPTSQVYSGLLGNTLVIVMPDTPEDVERFVKSELSGLPSSLLKDFPKASPMDWYFLVACHEAAHGPQIRARQGMEEVPLSAFTNTHDIRFKNTVEAIARLDNETQADAASLKAYFNMRAAGVPLGADTPRLFEALRRVSTLQHNGDFFTRDNLDGHLHDHASSPMLDVLDSGKVATEVFNSKDAAFAALQVNSAANAVVAAIEERNISWNWKPDPLERYAAVKFLHEKGYFKEGTPEAVIAREYVEAFETCVPDAGKSEVAKSILKKAQEHPGLIERIDDRSGWRRLIEDHLYHRNHEKHDGADAEAAPSAPRKPSLAR